jgi:hypothetical protein
METPSSNPFISVSEIKASAAYGAVFERYLARMGGPKKEK